MDISNINPTSQESTRADTLDESTHYHCQPIPVLVYEATFQDGIGIRRKRFSPIPDAYEEAVENQANLWAHRNQVALLSIAFVEEGVA